MSAQSSRAGITAESGYEPRERGIKRRERFLQVATEAFIRNGYDATSLQDIVAEAGGSLATLYRMFGNKEGLFEAVIDRKFESVFGEGEALEMTGRNPRAALTDLATALMEMILSEEAVAMHRLMITQAGRTGALREGFMRRAPDRGKQVLADYLAEEVRAKRLQVADCELSAAQFLGMVKGDILMRRLLGEEVKLSAKERKAIVKNAVDVFLEGILPD